ncbi:MAG: nucleotidyltransferase family protein [Sphingopyxis sp.]
MRNLVVALRDPTSVVALNGEEWSALIAVARAEVLLGTLAHRVAGQLLPPEVEALLNAARIAADHAQVQALWEAEMCASALAPLGVRFVLLKGTAYAAAGLPNADGRQIGDLDILVPRERLDEVEAALRGAGWEWVKDDLYDQGYYRTHMHELPPLIHGTRDRMIDVHHTILPLTARVRPDAAAMVADAIPASEPPFVSSEVETPIGSAPTSAPLDCARGKRDSRQYTLSPTDMVCHCAAHMMADGDLAGGLRNLWDMHCLLSEFDDGGDDFWPVVQARASHHGLWSAMHCAARLAHELYGTAIPDSWRIRGNSDFLFLRCLMARDDWGRETRPLTRLAFYIRSHMLRMPPLMLIRHLWTKWRAR